MNPSGHDIRLDCEAVVRLLWDYLDGRCEHDRKAFIEEHLALCESCRSHADFARHLLSQLRTLGSGEDDDVLRTRIVRALREAAADGDPAQRDGVYEP